MQNCIISAYGFYWKQRRFGGLFEQELKAYKERESFDNSRWNSYVTSRLRQIVMHAFEYVPYYRRSFSKAGFTITHLSKIDVESIIRLPMVTKDDLRENAKTTLISTKREKGGAFFSSSGSTGTPTQILYSHAMHQRWSAGFEARIRNWAGVDRFTPRGMIGGRRIVPAGDAKPPFYRYNHFERQTYFSAYHISAATARDYVEGIRRHGVEYMTGYAMSNFFLARFLQEQGIQAPGLKAVITSSEKLTPIMRQTFSDVYKCRTYDSWSGVEACALVSECEHGSLHVSSDMGIVEILDDNDNPVLPGEEGEVVCTGLLNFDQPLIRYRIGDRMRLASHSCQCGRSMPVVAEIVGRVEDTVVGRDGREMVRFHGVFIDLPNVLEGQIIQHDLDNIQVNVVTNGRFTLAEGEIIRKRMISQLGEVNINVCEVSNIPRNANGKFQAVISHVRRRENSAI